MDFTLPNTAPNLRETIKTLPNFIRLVKSVDPLRFWLTLLNGIFRAFLSWLLVYSLNVLSLLLQAPSETTSLLFWMGIVIVTGGLLSATHATVLIITDILRHKVEVAIYRMSIEKVTKVSLATLENAHFQALFHLFQQQSRYSIDVLNASYGIVFEGFELIGLLVGILIFPLPVLIILLVALLAKFALGSRIGVSSWSLFSLQSRSGKRALYYTKIFEQFPTAMEARLFGFADTFIKKWNVHIQSLLQKKMAITWHTVIALGVGDLIQIIGLFVGCYLIFNSNQPNALAGILPFIVAYQRFQFVGGQWFGDCLWFLECAPFLTVIKSFQAVPETTDKNKQTLTLSQKTPFSIKFTNVTFRYSGNTTDTLSNINLTLNSNEKLALVGSNGAGKSTFIKLLLGLYEPTKGAILINNQNLKEISLNDWRALLSVMLQNIPAYDDVLKEQIRYGDLATKFDKKRFQKALTVSGVATFIDTLPKGTNSHIGKEYAMPEDQAMEVSGGQRQMLAIARVLYRKASFYIFDEPTSAVDAEKEEHFFEALPEAVEKAGVLFISHRFSTVRRADRILVMENGNIIEDGSHKKLMKLKGRYAELFTKQAKMYK